MLQCDVRQFFPASTTPSCGRILAAQVGDPDVLWLIDRILESGAGVLAEEYQHGLLPGRRSLRRDRPRGLPIGNLTSQFWANCYLNPFDHFVKRELRCPAYLRYVDDFLLFADDKPSCGTGGRPRRPAGGPAADHPPGAQPRPVTEGFPSWALSSSRPTAGSSGARASPSGAGCGRDAFLSRRHAAF